MAGKYERYIIRQPVRDPKFFDKLAAGFMTMPPLLFLNGHEPIKEADHFAEAIWVFADGTSEGDPERQPHSHTFDELFMFLGTDREKMNELGGEVELWMGEGDEAEKYVVNTSSSIFVPKGVMHLPLIFRNVKKPFLMITICFNMGAQWAMADT